MILLMSSNSERKKKSLVLIFSKQILLFLLERRDFPFSSSTYNSKCVYERAIVFFKTAGRDYGTVSMAKGRGLFWGFSAALCIINLCKSIYFSLDPLLKCSRLYKCFITKLTRRIFFIAIQ